MSKHKQTRIMIKAAAKSLLARTMNRAFLVCLIYIAVPVALSSVTPQKVLDLFIGDIFPVGAVLVSLISFLLLTPLGCGLTFWYLRLIRRQEPKVSDLFSWFTNGERLWRSLGIGFAIAFFKTVVTGIFAAATGLYPYLKLREADARGFTFDWVFDLGLPIVPEEAAFVLNVSLVTYAAALASILICSLIFFRFSAVKNIHASNDRFGFFKTLSLSAKAMRGHYIETLKFHLSFLPWLLFALFTFGFGLAYAAPYYLTSVTLYYEYLIDARREPSAAPLALPGARMPDEEAPQPD